MEKERERRERWRERERERDIRIIFVGGYSTNDGTAVVINVHSSKLFPSAIFTNTHHIN